MTFNINSHKLDMPSAVVSRYSENSKFITVTYDCGKDGESPTYDILAVLNKHQVKATFFVTGKWVEKYPLLAKTIIAEGHEIGNHSYSHPDFTKLTPAEISDEVCRAENIIKSTVGVDPKPLIRQPFGHFSAKVLEVIGLLGYKYSIHWTVDPRDWELPPANVIVSRILDNISNGAIILLHNHSQATASASDIFIPELKKRGLGFTTISKALGNIHYFSRS